jgi:hypothetical protein
MVVAVSMSTCFGDPVKPAIDSAPSSAPHGTNRGSAARALLAIAVGALVISGIAGCATESTQKASTTHAAPYVGSFTGEFVDGVPLYRFPPIEVVGTRGLTW